MVKETAFYDKLGVAPDATAEQIKSAFRKASLKYHPDRHANSDAATKKEAEEKFKELANIYDVLSDAEKRKKYDQYGEKGVSQDMDQADPSDIFASLFGGGRRSRGEPKPKDIVHELPVALEHFYNGKVVKLAVTRDRLCTQCDGRGSNKPGIDARCSDCGGRGAKTIVRQIGPGFMQQMQTACQACQGRGSNLKPADRCPGCDGQQVIKEKKIFEVNVDKGMKRGDHVTFVGEGDQVPGVRLSGDIIIVLDQKPHAEFTRKGDHLYVEKTISLSEALTGFRRALTHLDGRTLVIQPPEESVIDPEFLYTVNREGMPIKGTGGTERGNLVVKFTVKFPTKVSVADAKKLRAVLGEPEAVKIPDDHDLGTLIQTTVDITREGSSHIKNDDDDEDDPRQRGGRGGPGGVQCAHQ